MKVCFEFCYCSNCLVNLWSQAWKFLRNYSLLSHPYVQVTNFFVSLGPTGHCTISLFLFLVIQNLFNPIFHTNWFVQSLSGWTACLFLFRPLSLFAKHIYLAADLSQYNRVPLRNLENEAALAGVTFGVTHNIFIRGR